MRGRREAVKNQVWVLSEEMNADEGNKAPVVDADPNILTLAYEKEMSSMWNLIQKGCWLAGRWIGLFIIFFQKLISFSIVEIKALYIV